jgi:hypothetical protein
VGHGTDNALFSKIALPVGHGVSAGILLSYERSHFDASATAAPDNTVRYETFWRPSGGFGIAWQPSKRWLFGFRALLNNDLEQRSDSSGTSEGIARSAELRLGGSVSPWEGALIDVGGTRLEKRNAIAGTHTVIYEPTVGFAQALLSRHLTLRFGVDELFGTESNSILATFTIDYGAMHGGH